MKRLLTAAMLMASATVLGACAPRTYGGQFTEPEFGWQRDGTYVLTPDEMEMSCSELRGEQKKAASAIAYIDSIQGQKLGQSLVMTGIAAAFGVVRLPNLGLEERTAKEQLRTGAGAFNLRLEEKGCDPSDLSEMIAEARRELRDAQADAEDAEEQKKTQSFKTASQRAAEEADAETFDHEMN